MKRSLEIIFMFALCLASFCAGWLMSLKHQKKLSQTALSASGRSAPESRLFSNQSAVEENPPPSEDISPSVRPEIGNPLSSPAPGLDNPRRGAAGDEEVKTVETNLPEKAPALPGREGEAKKARPLAGPELKRKEKFDKLNRKAFERIKNRQNVFNGRGRFSFLINVFSKEKKAVDYTQKLRGRFPLWGFFLKPDRENFKVYLGPFLTRERAEDFIKALTDPKPFPNYFLEEEGL